MTMTLEGSSVDIKFKYPLLSTIFRRSPFVSNRSLVCRFIAAK